MQTDRTQEQTTGAPSPGHRAGVSDQLRTVPRTDRLIILFVAVAVIIGSRALTPDASGYGTHRQLFMLPCFFHALTHLPCPLCGLTTAFTLTAHGQIIEAFESHLLGPPLWAATGLVALASALSLLPGMSCLRRMISILHSPEFARRLLLLFLIAWPVNVYLYVAQH